MRVSVDDRYSPLTRGRALNIVNVLIELLAMLLGAFEEGNKTHFSKFVNTFQELDHCCVQSSILPSKLSLQTLTHLRTRLSNYNP